MNELKNFAMGPLSTLGVLELTDVHILNDLETNPQSILIRGVRRAKYIIKLHRSARRSAKRPRLVVLLLASGHNNHKP